MLNKKTIFTILLACIPFVVFFVISIVFPQGFLQGGEIDYAFTLIIGFILFIWGMTMVYRVQFNKQRKILFAIFVVSFLWVVLRFIKWLSNIEVITVYADYLYYAPMVIIPGLTFALIVETFYPQLKHKKIIYACIVAITTIIILLALTNNLHHFVYKTTKISRPADNPSIINFSYTYGVGHFIMVGFILLLTLSAIALFFVGTAKQISFNQIVISSLLIIILITYTVLYTVGLDFIKNTKIIKDLALIIVIFLTAILETLLDVGLIQNNGRYEKNFSQSSLPMCIYDENNKILFKSEKFISSPNDNLKLRQKEIGTYTLVLQEDLTEITTLKEKILYDNKELSSINNMLEKLIKVNSEQSSISHRLSFANEIEHSIAKSRIDLEELVSHLPDKITPKNETETKQALGKIALTLGYMKQKCMLLLGAKERSSLSLDAFKMIMQIISKDIQSAGFKNVAFSVSNAENISFEFALKVNDLINEIAKTYCFNNLDVLLIINPNKDSCKVELDGSKVEIKNLQIEDLNITKQENGIRITMGEVENE